MLNGLVKRVTYNLLGSLDNNRKKNRNLWPGAPELKKKKTKCDRSSHPVCQRPKSNIVFIHNTYETCFAFARTLHSHPSLTTFTTVPLQNNRLLLKESARSPLNPIHNRIHLKECRAARSPLYHPQTPPHSRSLQISLPPLPT